MLHDESNNCISVSFKEFISYDSNACYHSCAKLCSPLVFKCESDLELRILCACNSCKRLGKNCDLGRIFSEDCCNFSSLRLELQFSGCGIVLLEKDSQ